MKWKSGLARCRASKALPSITRRKAPPCATTKLDLRSPISSRPCAKAGMRQQANPHQRRERGWPPRQRPRPLLPQATHHRTKRRRTRRRQHPLPPRRNLPRTRRATVTKAMMVPQHRPHRLQPPHPLRRNLPPPRLPLHPQRPLRGAMDTKAMMVTHHRAHRLQPSYPLRRNQPRTPLPPHLRPPLPQATGKRKKQRRQHPQPLHRNLPRTRLLPPPGPRPQRPQPAATRTIMRTWRRIFGNDSGSRWS